MNGIFTFHYVSIKTDSFDITNNGWIIFTFHYVSIKTGKPATLDYEINGFTFHYVSIKTVKLDKAVSNMAIYIPLCIY